MPVEAAYCVKCRDKRDMQAPKEVEFEGKGGMRQGLRGMCPVCGTKMFKILSKKN